VFARGSPLSPKFFFGLMAIGMIMSTFDLLLVALGAGQLFFALISACLAAGAVIAIIAHLKRHDGDEIIDAPSTLHGRSNANRFSLLDVIHAAVGADISGFEEGSSRFGGSESRTSADDRTGPGAFHTLGSMFSKCTTNGAAQLGAALAVISGTRRPFRAAA